MLAALPTAMWAAEKAYQTYRGVNATMTKARQFRRAPEQMRYLAQLCEALLAPLAVAEQLAVRHARCASSAPPSSWQTTPSSSTTGCCRRL